MAISEPPYEKKSVTAQSFFSQSHYRVPFHFKMSPKYNPIDSGDLNSNHTVSLPQWDKVISRPCSELNSTYSKSCMSWETSIMNMQSLSLQCLQFTALSRPSSKKNSTNLKEFCLGDLNSDCPESLPPVPAPSGQPFQDDSPVLPPPTQEFLYLRRPEQWPCRVSSPAFKVNG